MSRTDTFHTKYEKITEVFLEYGWIVSPFMIGRDFEKVYALSQKINAAPPTTDQARKNYQNEINELLTDIIFHPLFRAFFVYRSQELKYINNFSHHIERAILHYYKSDYFSAVHCLLPAIEGVLLAYRNWQYGTTRKPSLKELIQEIESCRSKTQDSITYQLFAKTLSAFLQKWIFSDTSIADMNLSFLNRHYILHGMGNANYYSLADTQRLIMFFDILIEFLSLEQNRNYVFIPDNNPMIDSRSSYYFKLIEDDLKWSQMFKSEKEFMKGNKQFIPEVNIPSWNKMLAKAAIEYIDFLKTLESIRNKKKE